MSRFQWINIFARDILLTAVMVWVNITLDYNSFFAALVLGMIIVLTTWHLNDLIKLNRSLSNGIYRLDGNSASTTGAFHNRLQQN